MPDFSIKIVPVSDGLVGFQPDLPGAQPGDPLYGPPSSLISWSNQTSDPQQLSFDDGSYTSNEILPGFTSAVDYIAPSTSGTVIYRSTTQSAATGSIVIQNVVPMPPISVLLLALALTGLFAPLGHAQTPPADTSQIPCLATQQPLVRIPEIISKDGKLRATVVTGTDQVRMPTRYPLTYDGRPSQPGDPQNFQSCFPEWVRTFRSPDTDKPWPTPTNGMDDPLPGPTLRARVGDFVELTLVNEIDPTKFGQSIDQETCDTTSVGYPGQAHDHFPDCFHGSTTVNMHFHGTHTNPTSTGDNVFLEILSSKRLVGDTPPPPPPNFDAWFARCETELSKGSHVEWPVVWDDLPKDYTAMQRKLLERFDKQPNGGGKSLWDIDQAAIDRHVWPQYYIGSYPYCYRLPQYPETFAAPPSNQGAGAAEMQAHQGMSSSAIMEQGGSLKMGQSPGTHWYHAHKHGSTTIDVSNGFVGAFIIEGQYDDEINEVYNAYGPEWTRTQPVMVINQFGTSPNLKGGAAQDKGPDFSVNGRTNPLIAMKPGEVQMWRILNASGRAGALFLAPPAGLNWKVLARDGVQFYTDNYAKSGNQSFLLASGNRIDLLVQAGPCSNPDGCTYPVQIHNTVDPSDLKPSTPPSRGPFDISLATVKVSGTALNMPFPAESPAKTFPGDLGDITDDEIKGTQTIDFGTIPPSFGNGAPPRSPAAVHTINGKLFDGEVGVSVLLNKVEEWKVTNSATFISHPFHIHINPFQISEVFAPNSTIADGKPVYIFDNSSVGPGQCPVNPVDPSTWKPCMATAPAEHRIWWDVFSIPSGTAVALSSSVCTELDKCPAAISKYTACTTGATPVCTVTIPGYFKMRSRFVDYPGWFVIHCHILAHEDRGMMTVVEVTPLVPPYSHH